MKNSNKTAETVYKANIDGSKFEYVLKRSSRKTISIALKKDGRVIVSCPLKTPLSYIEQLLVKKNGWIQEKLEEIRENSEQAVERNFENGDIFYYLGEVYRLKITRIPKAKKPIISLEAGLMVLHLPTAYAGDRVEFVLKSWYISEARLLLEDRIRKFSAYIGVRPEKLTIREQKTRWGSCSTKGNINMNWKLVMSPLEVVDYVVVHELCHLKEMNHSQRFWKLVESVIPQYKIYRKWLKDNGAALSLENLYPIKTFK